MMIDCDNLIVRDDLPELARGALPPARAAACEEHVATCAACREELALVAALQRPRTTPSIDVAAIVRALPAAPRPAVPTAPVVDIASRRRPRFATPQWRAAAAALVVALGIGGVAVANRGGPSVAASPSAPPAAVVPAGVTPPADARRSTPTVAAVAPATPVASAPAPVEAAPRPASPTTVASAPTAPALMVSGAAAGLSSSAQAQLLRELDGFDGQIDAAPERADLDLEGAGR